MQFGVSFRRPPDGCVSWIRQWRGDALNMDYRRVTNIRISAHLTHSRKFRNFVFFATEVTIFSGHNPLMYLRECAPKSAKLTRWALGLQEFMHADSDIFHMSVIYRVDQKLHTKLVAMHNSVKDFNRSSKFFHWKIL